MKEAAVEHYARRRVKEAGGVIRKVRWIGRRDAPDRLILLPGYFHRSSNGQQWVAPRQVWVEFKRPGEKPRGSQLREHTAMRKFGCDVCVIDSFEGVDALLAK